MTYQEFNARPVENVARGTIFALIIIPAGVIVFVLIWNLGFLASIVSYGVAYGAVFLYRFGAGGIIGRAGAIRIAIITIGTVLLSLFVAIVSDVATSYSMQEGTTPLTELTDPFFWPNFQYSMSQPGVFAEYLPSIAIGLGLGLLGCFSLLRGAFRATAGEARPSEQPVQPLFPTQRAEPDYNTAYKPSADAAAPVAPFAPAAPPVAPQYGELAPPVVPPVAPEDTTPRA